MRPQTPDGRLPFPCPTRRLNGLEELFARRGNLQRFAFRDDGLTVREQTRDPLQPRLAQLEHGRRRRVARDGALLEVHFGRQQWFPRGLGFARVLGDEGVDHVEGVEGGGVEVFGWILEVSKAALGQRTGMAGGLAVLGGFAAGLPSDGVAMVELSREVR